MIFRPVLMDFALLASASAFAGAHEGDYALYVGEDVVSGDPVNFELRVIAAEAVDESLTYLTIQRTLNVAGSVTADLDREVDSEMVMTESLGALIARECASSGHLPGTFVLSGRAIDSCLIDDPGAKVRFGAAPFGVLEFAGDLARFPYTMEQSEGSVYPLKDAVELRLAEFGSGP